MEGMYTMDSVSGEGHGSTALGGMTRHHSKDLLYVIEGTPKQRHGQHRKSSILATPKPGRTSTLLRYADYQSCEMQNR